MRRGTRRRAHSSLPGSLFLTLPASSSQCDNSIRVTTMKRLSFAALIVFGSLFATHVIAEIITASPISGNFALTTAGYEIVFDGTNTFHFDIVGEGLVTADGSGNLSGSANFMATNPSSSPVRRDRAPGRRVRTFPGQP